jgi:hypothetical protein
MVFQVPQNWDIAIDGFQILLCLLILGLYFKNRAIHKKLAVNKIKNGGGQSFNAHVFNRIVKQQVDQALTNIVKTIAAERNGLESVLELNPLSSEDDDISKVQSNSQLPNSHDNHRISDDRSGSAGRHDKVRKFSAKGLSARKIAEELKIPIGEVELILSLQKK